MNPGSILGLPRLWNIYVGKWNLKIIFHFFIHREFSVQWNYLQRTEYVPALVLLFFVLFFSSGEVIPPKWEILQNKGIFVFTYIMKAEFFPKDIN